MHKLKSILITLPALSLIILGSFSAIAYADHGSSSGGGSGNTTGDDPTGNTGGQTVGQPGPKEASTAETQTTETENQTEAKDLLQNLRKDHKEHSEADRQKNCQAAEHGLETKLTNLGKNAAAFQARIDKILAQGQSFQSTNNLTVSNWATLLAAAQAAQTKAASSIAALQALNVNLDCTSPTVAENVATFRAAAQQARTDLQSYKQAVRALLEALKTVADSQPTGGNQ